ncbi:MAG: cytochrome ubiquinol oxidase subunit II [Sulfobacillus acidophilus]|uniref:Cytochrome ubiquinol oxidase subunit II n=1 Tax=Sulfobacillus acidophilus TaxID=53633 RepID=A0A2T2WEE1_9FIRM|nr:MAG: cytochrome ubiquinol oxidase subunit II [Sulfobacillus acidophilus]
MPPVKMKKPLMAAIGLGLSGCGADYSVFHPAGPVAQSELNAVVISTIVVAVIIFLIWGLWLYVLIRFRDTPRNHAPYRPNWRQSRPLEIAIFALPVAALLVLAVPTVKKTYALAHVPSRHPLVVDVTSLDYKWVFQYPRQHIATVNYFYIPIGRPVLFQLTAHSPMTALWAPNLGGMEYAMPNRVLPLWLEATRTGTFLGRNANYNGIDYWCMTFLVHAVSPLRFTRWVKRIQTTKPSLTVADWRQLSRHTVAAPQAYSNYPADTFPEKPTQFTVRGLYYVPTHKP